MLAGEAGFHSSVALLDQLNNLWSLLSLLHAINDHRFVSFCHDAKPNTVLSSHAAKKNENQKKAQFVWEQKKKNLLVHAKVALAS